MQELLLELIKRDLANQGITNYNLSLVNLSINEPTVTPVTTKTITLPSGLYYINQDEPANFKTYVDNCLRFDFLSDNGSASYERFNVGDRIVYLRETTGLISHNENITVNITPNSASGSVVLTIPLIYVSW